MKDKNRSETPVTMVRTERPDGDDLGACRQCGASLNDDEQYRRYRVCSNCGYHDTLGAPQRIELLVDAGSFEEFNRHLVSVDPLVFADRLPYRERVLEAREHTGLTEAAVTGTARIAGHEVILAVLDFRFLGGSMGSVVGEKLTSAFERAAEKKLPIITIAASGGARMQEGMLSLVQMAKTAAAAKRVHDDHVLYISVLTNPTTGGVTASYAMLGDVQIAEPGALIGFAGARVIEQTIREKLPEGFQRAEYLKEHGMVDMVVHRHDLRPTLARLCRLLTKSPALETVSKSAQPVVSPAQIVSAPEVAPAAPHA